MGCATARSGPSIGSPESGRSDQPDPPAWPAQAVRPDHLEHWARPAKGALTVRGALLDLWVRRAQPERRGRPEPTGLPVPLGPPVRMATQAPSAQPVPRADRARPARRERLVWQAPRAPPARSGRPAPPTGPVK